MTNNILWTNRNFSFVTFDFHVPIDRLSDVVLELVNFAVVELSVTSDEGRLALWLFGRRILGVDVRRCRRYRIFGTDVTVDVQERVQTNGVQHKRREANDQEIGIASQVAAAHF